MPANNNNKTIPHNETLKKTKKVLVTGGTDGIGRETALGLARLGYDVTIAGRSQQKADEVIGKADEEELKTTISFHKVDFTNLDEIQSFAQFAVEGTFDVIVLNAGVMLPTDKVTKDEIDTTIQVNFLSSYHVTKKLLEAAQPVHIVFLTSILIKAVRLLSRAQFNPKKTESWELMCSSSCKRSGWTKYAMSKYGMAVLASMVARSGVQGITATAVHPGSVMTNLTSNLGTSKRKNLRVFKFMLTSVDIAASNVIQACLAPLKESEYLVENRVKKLDSRISCPKTSAAMEAYAERAIGRLH